LIQAAITQLRAAGIALFRDEAEAALEGALAEMLSGPSPDLASLTTDDHGDT
jgi:hypothetical protein